MMKTLRFFIRRLVRISPFHFLIASAKEVGWGIAIEKGDAEDIVEGIVIGTEEFITRHTPKECHDNP